MMTMNTTINPTIDPATGGTTARRYERIAVIGGGSWGTALAGRLAANGNDTVLWAYEPELVEEINSIHTNTLYLPGINLHPALACTASLEEAVPRAEHCAAGDAGAGHARRAETARPAHRA